MATKAPEMETKAPDSQVKSQFEVPFKSDYVSDWDVHRKFIQTLDPLEAMLIGQVYDSVSGSIDGAKITDSYTATLAIERAARVMGKLPTGVTEATKADQGKAAFMDILRQKWIYPNANSQLPFEQKMELVQLYSDVYGYMPVFRDWNVAPNGYIGPDCWLWNPRNLVFQQGKTFFNDMEYVTALTWVSKKFIEDLIEDQTEGDDGDENKENKENVGGWDLAALQELLSVADHPTGPDGEKDTQVARSRTPMGVKKGICLATRYEAGEDGHWVTFAPDHGYCQVRDIENPHKNGKIPFRIKYSQELFDSVYGLGDFARSKPLQFAADGLTNFYFKGIKMNLIPPIVVNANGVLKHTIDYREGSVMMETIPNSVRRLETSSAGLATYQAAKTALTGSLLSLWGSQNAAAPSSETLNPSQGKTPAAISLYSDKEADRDGRARKRMENLIQELTNDFYELIVNIGTETIPIDLFAADLQQIEDAGFTDVGQLFKGFKPNATFTGGQLEINPETLRDIEFTFRIEWGSTAVINKQQQLQQLQDMWGDLAKFANLFQEDPSIQINFAPMLKMRGELADVPGADKFVTIKTPAQVQMEQQQAQQVQNMKNPVMMPNGTVREFIDLAKIYTAPTTPDDVKNEILVMIGLQPSKMPSPSATTQAAQHSQIVNDAASTDLAQKQHQLEVHKHLLAVAQGADQAAQANQPEAAPEAQFSGGGAYNDPVVAGAADHISKL
jgi:hypothetical protein